MKIQLNEKNKKAFPRLERLLVTMLGFEPRTYALEVRCSIQLSYIAIVLITQCEFKKIYL
jgi:hypothetical protein